MSIFCQLFLKIKNIFKNNIVKLKEIQTRKPCLNLNVQPPR